MKGWPLKSARQARMSRSGERALELSPQEVVFLIAVLKAGSTGGFRRSERGAHLAQLLGTRCWLFFKG